MPLLPRPRLGYQAMLMIRLLAICVTLTGVLASASPQNTPSASGATQENKQGAPPPPGNANQQATSKRRHHNRSQTPGDSPTKKVVREGGTAEVNSQISPSMTLEEASHQRQTTAQLLTSTDLNLKKISSRRLDLSQQATLGQINTFIQQAKKATTAGDVQRGHNLALKALLLSDDLVKH